MFAKKMTSKKNLPLFVMYGLAKKFQSAIEKYTQAVELNPNVAVYYANRSFAYMKTEAYGFAVADADKAVTVDPSYVKVTIIRNRFACYLIL